MNSNNTTNEAGFLAWLSSQTHRQDVTGELARIFAEETVLAPVAELLDVVITEWWADTVRSQTSRNGATVVQDLGDVGPGVTVTGVRQTATADPGASVVQVGGNYYGGGSVTQTMRTVGPGSTIVGYDGTEG